MLLKQQAREHWPVHAVYFPAVLACAIVFGADKSPEQRTWLLTATLFQPALLLIDHGHFQYNCISLGLTVSHWCQNLNLPRTSITAC